MTVKTQRRPRGTGTGRVDVFVQLSPETKHKFDAIVAATGAPRWAVIETLIDRVELGPSGQPTWWVEPDNHQEALDISA